jgi:hypothetical protein
MKRRFIAILDILILVASLKAVSLYAQRGAPQPPASPELLFSMTTQNETRLPLGQDSITTPNMDVHLYGDGKNIIVAVGKGANFPRTFFGLCEKPCGFTLRDRNNYFDLRGRANIKFTTIVSGFHRVRPFDQVGRRHAADRRPGRRLDGGLPRV